MKKLVFAMLVVLTVPALAFADRPKDPLIPVIEAALVDFSGLPYQAQITGENLVGANQNLFSLSIGGVPVEFYSLLSETQINFEVPAAIADQGTYLLTLKNSGGQVVYELAIGATGPAGAQGSPGPEGPQGPAGGHGHNSLILLTDEPAGANCPDGGTWFQAGVDTNGNNLLDADEVHQARYVCNGTASETQPPALIKVTAAPSTQAVNAFVNVTATATAAPSAASTLHFYAAGSCLLFDPVNSKLDNYAHLSSLGGVASVAMTNTDPAGGPCVVYAGYDDFSTNTSVVGSALANFLPTLPAPPEPPATMTVTATPATQSVNAFVNVTATMATPTNSSISFYTGGTCRLFDAATASLTDVVHVWSMGGTASVAMTNTAPGGGPCIVFAGSYDSVTQKEFSGTALATFVP